MTWQQRQREVESISKERMPAKASAAAEVDPVHYSEVTVLEPLVSMVASVRQAIQTGNWYSAICLALALPDICGWLETPNVRSSERFVSFFDRFLAQAYTRPVGAQRQLHVFLSGNNCYALRCAFLHEGCDQVERQNAHRALTAFRFVAPSRNIVHMNQSGTVLQLQVDIFCEDICGAVEGWMATGVAADAEVLARLQEMLVIDELDGAVRLPLPPRQ